MNSKRTTSWLALSFAFMIGFELQGCSASKGKTDNTAKSDTTRSITAYFSPAITKLKTPNAEGFIQRWLLLEPISKPNRANTVFTDSYIRKAFDTLYFSNQFTILAKDGERVKVGGQELTWHALDSKNFNVKLFRFGPQL